MAKSKDILTPKGKAWLEGSLSKKEDREITNNLLGAMAKARSRDINKHLI